jgi:C4-dicarboxylate-specific signal transduction histidine kinase
MGLGLSIARRSALLCGGDLEALDLDKGGELGGAAFRLSLARGNGKSWDTVDCLAPKHL